MEFHERLLELRKRKGLTQEELAEALYVSRTAVSRWESGRGYPNIESLKAISKLFSVTIDELLTGEEALTIAEEDHREKESQSRDLVFGLMDCSISMFLFLPVFRQQTEGVIQNVSLLALDTVAPYTKVVCLVVMLAIIGCGVMTLALQTCRNAVWIKAKHRLSLGCSALGVLLFAVSLQPYATIFLFVFLVVKALMLIKWQ